MFTEKKIKVLFRHRSMEMGGVEKVLLSLLNNLDPDKFEMTVCLNLNQGELREAFPNHVRKVSLTAGKEDFSSNPIIQKVQIAKRRLFLEKLRNKPEIIDQKYLKDKYDVEIAMTYGDFESVLNSSNKNSKKIGWFHSDITVPKLQPMVPKILQQIPLFDFFVWGSQQTKDIFEDTYPTVKLPPNQVILNAIPINEIKLKAKEFPVSYNKKTFVAVGRLHSRKGFHVLMEAHKKLLEDGFDHQVVVIGDGEERPTLEKQASMHSVTDTFKLIGTLANPYPHIKNADYFIMPSESEGWPLIIAETLILRKPIIATNVGGIPEMITNEKNGLLVNYSAQDLYQAMKEFLTNEILVSHIVENLIDSEKQFDNKKIFDAVESIILKLANS